jgi:hypothetical protein
MLSFARNPGWSIDQVLHAVMLLLLPGSAAYGFWYRMLDNPEGPSRTTESCPKFTPLRVFKDNVAHSNMFYGLRIHPEFYPKINPCHPSSYSQVPAVFDGLVSYKNGMKCAIATQVAFQSRCSSALLKDKRCTSDWFHGLGLFRNMGGIYLNSHSSLGLSKQLIKQSYILMVCMTCWITVSKLVSL